MIKRASITLLVIAALVLSIQNAYSYSGAFSAAPGIPKVSASANKKTFAPGESGYITIHFKKSEHQKIPKDPEVEVSLNGVTSNGLEDYSAEAGDYITSGKVKVKFTVPSDAASGSSIKVTGNVKFGYCSTDDGTCRLAKKDFSVNLKVK